MENIRDLIANGKPKPMYNGELHRFGLTLTADSSAANDDGIGELFKIAFHGWLTSSRLNVLDGLDAFQERDVIHGVTSYIDDIYQMNLGRVYTIEKEYMYHQRLYGTKYVTSDVGSIPVGSNLIIGMPFPYYGDKHPEMDRILEECVTRDVSVHIDSAWIGCTKGIGFNYDHPAISSIGFSLSKGLGLGYSRIGVRYCRKRPVGPITIMNDHTMIPRTMCWWGMRFMERFEHDYLQDRYGKLYDRLCDEVGLIPTKSIHLAHMPDGGSSRPVGVRDALRYMDEHQGH